mmetsp:Transcript_25971/g.34081  ORF Transcript_25971/g.34081 Transcript_25971/m.34081 type:complete len:577 (+) Transcript_25971:125-1855(+)
MEGLSQQVKNDADHDVMYMLGCLLILMVMAITIEQNSAKKKLTKKEAEKPKELNIENVNDSRRLNQLSVEKSISLGALSSLRKGISMGAKKGMSPPQSCRKQEMSKQIQMGYFPELSDPLTHTLIGASNPIVSAQVCGFSTVHSDTKRYTLYTLKFENSEGEKWTVYRRYSAFLENYTKLKEEIRELNFSFPEKSLFGSHKWIKQKRMESFQEYLNLVISLRPIPLEFIKFIEPTRDDLGRPAPLQIKPAFVRYKSVGKLINPMNTDQFGHRGKASRRNSLPGYIISQSPSAHHRVRSVTGMFNSIEDNYAFASGKHLGFGQHAVVKRCKQKNSPGKEVAIKAVLKNQVENGGEEILLQEIEILRRLDHPYVMKLLDVVEDNTHMYLITELCAGGELYHWAKAKQEKGGISEKEIKIIVQQILLSVRYLHDDLRVVHRDLKPENILLKNGDDTVIHVQVIDFGLSTYIPENGFLTELVGTPLYVAPEVLNRKYTQACDIWSVGVVMYSLISGHVPFGGKSRNDIYKAVKRGQVSFRGGVWKNISPSAKEFLWAVFTLDQNRRLTAYEALKHAWLSC